MSHKLGRIQTLQNVKSLADAADAVTQRLPALAPPVAVDLDAVMSRLALRVSEHAATTRYTLDVLRVLQLAGNEIAPLEAARIRAAALSAFRIEGLSVADSSDAVDEALAAE